MLKFNSLNEIQEYIMQAYLVCNNNVQQYYHIHYIKISTFLKVQINIQEILFNASKRMQYEPKRASTNVRQCSVMVER